MLPAVWPGVCSALSCSPPKRKHVAVLELHRRRADATAFGRRRARRRVLGQLTRRW